MAFGSGTIWEVRSVTGSDANAGGFDPGVAAPGTDYSQQAAAQVAYTDLVIDGTTNTKITSAAHPFDATSPGNFINITGGAGFTVQIVEILSVAAGVATCDKAVGTISSTGGTGNLGGAKLTLGSIIKAASSLCVAGNIVYGKGTFNEAVTISLSGSAGLSIQLIGYTTTRTDGGYMTIDGGNARANCLINNTSINFWLFKNIVFQGPTAAHVTTVTNGQTLGTQVSFVNCKFINGSATPANVFNPANYGCTVYALFEDCEMGGTPAAKLSGAIATSNAVWAGPLIRCYIHDAASGFTLYGYAAILPFIIDNEFSNIAGTVFGGAASVSGSAIIINNTLYSCGVLDFSGSGNTLVLRIENNIFSNGTGYGVKGYSTDQLSVFVKNNAYYSMTSGFISPGTAYDGGGNISLTAAPLTSPGTGNFGLNNTAGGGASCRAAGLPGAIIGTITTGYLDMGAAQHQDAGGAAASTPIIVGA